MVYVYHVATHVRRGNFAHGNGIGMHIANGIGMHQLSLGIAMHVDHRRFAQSVTFIYQMVAVGVGNGTPSHRMVVGVVFGA